MAAEDALILLISVILLGPTAAQTFALLKCEPPTHLSATLTWILMMIVVIITHIIIITGGGILAALMQP